MVIMKKMMIGFLLVLMALLSGCQTSEVHDASVNLCIIVANRKNQPDFSDSETLNTSLKNVIDSYGKIQIIVPDGAPYIQGTYSIEKPAKRMSSRKAADWRDMQISSMYNILTTTRAQTPEVDLLSAISLAGRWLNDREGEKQLLIIDNGLSTVGLLDFTKNLIRVDADTIAEYLEEKEAIPSLNGVVVTWVGLGDTADSQKALTPANRKNLECIWNSICITGGANSVTFRGDAPSTGNNSESLPEVTPIDIIAEEPMEVSETQSRNWWLGEEKCQFLPDSAEFVDIDATKSLLQPIVEAVANEDLILGFCGTTARAPGATEQGCQELSMERALAVEELMLEMGMDMRHIGVTLGRGYNHPYYIDDRNEDGTLNEQMASANRSVIIFSLDSEVAEKLLKE